MAEKKKQHYVPKLYMKNFADSKNNVSVYNIRSKSIISDVPYDSQCYKNYFYGKDHILEDEFAKKEIIWERLLTKIIKNEVLIKDDIESIKKFSLYQRQRTLGEAEYHKDEHKELLMDFAKEYCEKNGIYFDNKLENICDRLSNEGLSPGDYVALVDKMNGVIDDLDLLIITYETKNRLIFSDVPIIFINPFHKFSIGCLCVGLIILFPVSPTKLVVLYDSKIYPKYKYKKYLKINNENEVKTLNTLQFISAEKALYANHSNDFQVFTNENWKQRSLNRDSKKINTIGTYDDKIVGFSARKTFLDCTLSFGMFSNNIKRIPFICREAFPRQYSEQWRDKLQTKIQIMPLLLEQNPELFKGYTKKEIRKGCTDMLDFALAYWKMK